jgi:hypothetical protein
VSDNWEKVSECNDGEMGKVEWWFWIESNEGKWRKVRGGDNWFWKKGENYFFRKWRFW